MPAEVKPCCCGSIPEVERMVKVYYLCWCGCGRWGMASSEEAAVKEFHDLQVNDIVTIDEDISLYPEESGAGDAH